MRARAVWAAAALLAGLAAGCGGGGPAPDTRTAAQYFRDRQAATATPYGRIRTGSVAESGGAIEYDTDDGSRWRVTFDKRTDGTYDYGTPEPVRK